MIAEYLVHFLLLCILVGAVVVGFFMWLNAWDSKVDEGFYEENFDPGKTISKAATKVVPNEEPDPVVALRAYAQPTHNDTQILKRAPDIAPPEGLQQPFSIPRSKK